jgi:putative DNA primase/helicase
MGEGEDKIRRAVDGAEPPPAPGDGEPRSPEFSDDALACEFTERHGEDLRYVASWGDWLLWDGSKWSPEKTLAAFDLARAVCVEAAERCAKKREATGVASASTIAAVERLARSDRVHASTVDQWDCDGWLLNTPQGTIDFRTGEMRAHRRDDYLTKITAVAPGGKAPTWLTFIHRITAGDADLQLFLQRMVGYGLTGSTKEHAFFFLHGCGANGKTTFLETLAELLRDYHTVAPIEMFMSSRNERHPTDLASLRGARLVTASEVSDGRAWDVAKVKALTGGDRIKARFMRQDFFEFTPLFKLIVAGNHRPSLRSIDEAIRRRLYLVPFTVTIPESERDQELRDKLRAEFPGILAWAVEGAMMWQGEGLAAPESVRAATDDYLASEDSVARWIEDDCDLDGKYVSPVAALFASWRLWCERAGEYIGSGKRLSQALLERGFVPIRLHGGTRGFIGIQLKPESFDS